MNEKRTYRVEATEVRYHVYLVEATDDVVVRAMFNAGEDPDPEEVHVETLTINSIELVPDE